MSAPQLTAYIQGQGVVSGDQLNTFCQTADNVTQLRALIGLPGMEVLLRGTNTPGDGGANAFYWNATSIGPDNGTTVIVPTGAATGAWVALPFSTQGLTFTAPGTGGVPRSVNSKLADTINVADYGVLGGGAPGDTTAMQNALNEAGALGVQFVNVGPLIIGPIGSIIVPPGVTLQGLWADPGLINNNENYYTLPSQIILASGASIEAQWTSGVIGLIISRAGLSLPPTNNTQGTTLLSQFAGTGIQTVGSDIIFRNLLLLGHNIGLQTNLGETPTQMGRLYCENVKGDCNSGIVINDSGDTCRLFGCHFWPFMTVNIPSVSNANLQRPGSAYAINNSGDWTEYFGCFSFGYQYGYNLNNASAIRIIGGGCDDDGPNGPGGQNFGIAITGTNVQTQISGTFINSKQQGLYVDTGAPIPNVQSTGNAYNTVIGINVATGYLSSVNDSFNDSTNGILCGSGTAGVICADYFNNVPTPWQFADSPTSQVWSVVGNNFRGGSFGWSGAGTQLFGTLDIIQMVPQAANAGAQLNFNNNYDAYTGVAWVVDTPLIDGSTGAEASNFQLQRYRSGALIPTFQIDYNGNVEPATDNTYSMGIASLRWSVIYSATGTINTSGGDDKTDIADLPAALPIVEAIKPKSFRFKVGKRVHDPAASKAAGKTVMQDVEGKRTHTGFIAGDVKAAAPAGMDWAAYCKGDDGSEGLRHDELLPIAWKAIQELSAQVKALQAKLGGAK